MKGKLEKLPEKPGQKPGMSLYRRKTDKDDLIVLSLGSGGDEDVVTSIELDDIQINIALISRSRQPRERVISEAKPIPGDTDRD